MTHAGCGNAGIRIRHRFHSAGKCPDLDADCVKDWEVPNTGLLVEWDDADLRDAKKSSPILEWNEDNAVGYMCDKIGTRAMLDGFSIKSRKTFIGMSRNDH